MNEEMENPYCEICGTCGYIGCCGIRNFIKQHIEGKTNCKNEDVIISELIDLCEYKDDVFKLNNQLQQENKQLKRNIEIKNAYCQLIADLGFDYDGCKQADSLKGLIDELAKYALASRNNDDGIVVYEDGFNKKFNILNEEIGLN